MKKQKIVVISADALVGDDMEYLSSLPNYKKYIAGGVRVNRVRSIYPTVTYPCHVTMSTGAYPEKHGVVSNFVMEEGKPKKAWEWFSDIIKIPDIFTAAKAAGYTTAAVFWPVTGNHPSIDHLIDEYWTQFEGDTPRAAFERSGSSQDVLVNIVDKYLPILVERKHPECDMFVASCAAEMIRRYDPDLLMIHPADIDGFRHKKGVFSDILQDALRNTDEYIGMIGRALEEAGTLEQTNFILVSDHGQMDVKRILNPNVILADHGHIKVDENGTLVDWDAYCHSCGMSALVMLKDENDRKKYDAVYETLCFMRDEGIYGISEVLTREEAKQEHLAGKFSFVLETDGYTSFGDSYVRPIVKNHSFGDYRFGRATHGYKPYKGPQPVFAAKGPAFKKDYVREEAVLVDEAPTYAKILGVELPYADGNAMEDLLV